MNNDKKLLEAASEAVEKVKAKVNSDYYRLKHHLMPPAGYMNDPNGFIQINGEYHLFYQFNPLYPYSKRVYWAHVKSSDLVNWASMPIALAPCEWYETHGCYSGSAVNNNGIFTLMYTGNVKNEAGDREAYQCIAESSDGVYFNKYKNNPVINGQPEEYNAHFRDPKVWKHNGVWYMVIGTQTKNEQGAAVLYRSDDLFRWDKVGEISSAKDRELEYLGYMWECPNLFNLDGTDVLLFCPQGVKAKGDLYNNIYQCGYFLGSLDYNTGKIEHRDFCELDRGFEFYAPQITQDKNGRTLLIGWMGLPEEDESPTVENGWLHCLTCVRELHIKNNKIYQIPAKEMKSLRKNEVLYNNIIIEERELELDKIYGDCYELLCEFAYASVEEFGIKLRCSEFEEEKTLLYYAVKEEKLVLDRDSSDARNYKKGIRKCKIEDNGKVRMQIFMDRSAVEIFVNDGEETFTARIYPGINSKHIIFYAKGGSVKLNINYWEI